VILECQLMKAQFQDSTKEELNNIDLTFLKINHF